MVNSKAAISSLTHLRPLTYAASATSSYPAQLVPDPPNLIAWVTREGGYVHPALKIAHSHHFNGLGLVSNQQIPAGTNLIILPDHIPLSFRSFESEDSVDYALAQLARQVPALGRGTMGNETWFEASSRQSKSWIILVAIYKQSPTNIQCAYLLSWGRHKELAVCSCASPGKQKMPVSS